MAKKVQQILGLGAALAALSGAIALTPAPAAASVPTTDQAGTTQKAQAAKGTPNVFFPAGKDMLGLIVSTAANGISTGSNNETNARHGTNENSGRQRSQSEVAFVHIVSIYRGEPPADAPIGPDASISSGPEIVASASEQPAKGDPIFRVDE